MLSVRSSKTRGAPHNVVPAEIGSKLAWIRSVGFKRALSNRPALFSIRFFLIHRRSNGVWSESYRNSTILA